MTNVRKLAPTIVSVGLVLAMPAVVLAQRDKPGGPLSGPPVTNAPFSADATTTVRQVLGDGTRIEHTGTARYYRDRAGRVRVEQRIIGLEPLSPGADSQVRITILPDPDRGVVYTLDPKARTVAHGSRSIAGLAIGGGSSFAVPLGGSGFLVFQRLDEHLQIRYGLVGLPVDEESLGQRVVSGILAVGSRHTLTVPKGQWGNDRPMQIVDERWESPDLKMVIYARHSDPRTGVVEYQVTNIRRAEPRADLFVVPADYVVTTTKASTTPGNAAGDRCSSARAVQSRPSGERWCTNSPTAWQPMFRSRGIIMSYLPLRLRRVGRTLGPTLRRRAGQDRKLAQGHRRLREHLEEDFGTAGRRACSAYAGVPWPEGGSVSGTSGDIGLRATPRDFQTAAA